MVPTTVIWACMLKITKVLRINRCLIQPTQMGRTTQDPVIKMSKLISKMSGKISLWWIFHVRVMLTSSTSPQNLLWAAKSSMITTCRIYRSINISITTITQHRMPDKVSTCFRSMGREPHRLDLLLWTILMLQLSMPPEQRWIQRWWLSSTLLQKKAWIREAASTNRPFYQIMSIKFRKVKRESVIAAILKWKSLWI